MNLYEKYSKFNLVLRIIIGLFIGIILGLVVVNISGTTGAEEINSTLKSLIDSPMVLFGEIFIGSLSAIAPLLVFFLVTSALSQKKKKHNSNISKVILVYLIATFCAALISTIANFVFPVEIALDAVVSGEQKIAPQSVGEVIGSLISGVFINPITAISEANYLSILFWASLFGVYLRNASITTVSLFSDIADCLTSIVKIIINFAPFGISGLVYTVVSTTGFEEIINYSNLALLVVFIMLFMALIVNPLIVYLTLKTNPYPIVFKCLSRSGINAFFTRSSAANIPINLELCNEMNVEPEMSNVTIPLGATINMAGAAVTITTLTLTAAHSTGVEVSFAMAFVLSIVASVSACGASGVSGGSILLIPLACSLFGLDESIATKMVEIGFIISVVQDSFETALNSSSDALFTITIDKYTKLKEKVKI